MDKIVVAGGYEKAADAAGFPWVHRLTALRVREGIAPTAGRSHRGILWISLCNLPGSYSF